MNVSSKSLDLADENDLEIPRKIQETALELAALYMEYGSNAKAVKTLEELLGAVDSATQTTVTYLALGDIYSNDGSDELARKSYQKAIELALAAKDYQVVVAAKAGLASVETVVESADAARSLLQEANDEFKKLKETEQWSELGERLRNLTSKDKKLLFLGLCEDCKVDGTHGRWQHVPPYKKRCKRC